MALQNDSGYIRMLPYGSYEIYKSAEERGIYKEGHNPDDIIKAYEDLIFSIEAQVWTEIDGQHRFGSEYPDMDTPIYNSRMKEDHPDAWNIAAYLIHIKDEPLAQRWNDARAEKIRYTSSVFNDSVSYEDFCKMSFPMMEQIHTDIAQTKLRPNTTGSFHLDIENVADVYEDVKKMRFFGDTEDV